MTDTRRRVKLYALNADRQWDDRGTGHVSSSYVDRLKGISLLVRAESDGSLLLESKIQPDTAYQKQQDTLIVWSEGDNFDLALSFQEKAGCDEIWEKICQVQGKDPSVEITQDIVEESEDERFDDMSDSAPPVELPSCELSRLEDINELISNCLSSPVRKEKLATAIESDGYIKKLLNLFHMCEDLENSEGLHYLYDIFKNIFLLNKNALFEVMFSEDTIFDVIGCLEYEPSQSAPKRHREYLRQQAKFREAIPIKNPELLSKIHQTFRVQYIQDVVLPTPSVFEDNMLSTLSSFIFFNKIEIVTLVQEDEKFLVELFQMLTDETTSELKRRDLVLFLKEFCNYSQNLQPQAKETFYKTLTNLDILPALEITLASDDPKTKTASIDILTYIVEFSPSVVRAYTLQQANNTDEDHMLLNIIMEQMICDTDPELGGAVQLMGVLRILLDPENMLASVNKSEKSDFLNFFYKHSVHILIAPLLENTVHGEPSKEDYKTVQLLGLILELLSFCVEHHTYHIKNCVLNKDLLRRILVLMKSTHKFLVLCALRFMRKLIALKDEFYNRYIIKGNLFAPVVDAFVRNNGRYNLLDSAIIEMFEFIKLEDIKTLCSHVVENYGKRLDTIEYVQTFKALKLRYDHYQDILKDREHNLDSVPSILRTSRYRRDQRQLDEEEEMWFNEDDDFEDNEAVVPATNDLLSKKLDPDLDSIGKIMDNTTKTQKQQTTTTTESNGPKVNSTAIANKQPPVLNNNATSVAPAGVAVQDTKPSALFKKVRFSFSDPPLTSVVTNNDNNELIPAAAADDDETNIELFLEPETTTFDVDLTSALYTLDMFDDDDNSLFPTLQNIESIESSPPPQEEIDIDKETTSVVTSETDTSEDSSNIVSELETSYNLNSLMFDTSYITTTTVENNELETLSAVDIASEVLVLTETTYSSVTLPDNDTLVSVTETYTLCNITHTVTNQPQSPPPPPAAGGNDTNHTDEQQPIINLDVQAEPMINVDANITLSNNIHTPYAPSVIVVDPSNDQIMVKGLVDYEGDSDEDEEEGEVLTPNAKRPRLS